MPHEVLGEDGVAAVVLCSACGSGADDVVVDGSAGSASDLDSALLRRTQEVLRVVRGRHSWVLYPRIVVTNSG